MTEIFRAGIQSVSHGQSEAADALGMTYRQKMRRVVLPQAFRVVIPPTGNEFIAMMKDTALVSVLGQSIESMELFRRRSCWGTRDVRPLEALVTAAGLYWALTAVFTFFQARLERRVSRGVSAPRRPRAAGARERGKVIVTGAGGERGARLRLRPGRSRRGARRAPSRGRSRRPQVGVPTLPPEDEPEER